MANLRTNRSYLGYIFVAIFSAVFFGLMQMSRTFADPDAFYHAKMEVLMLKQGIVRDFPWLAYTPLTQIYTDHHFLYHVLLIPFVKFFPPLIGIKIATVFINTIFILLFYGFLRKQKIPRPFFFVFLLLSAAPFVFRIDLDKANGLSLVFVMLILFAIFTPSSPPPWKGGGRWGWLAILSFFYVWSYGGWPIGIFIAGIYFIASIFAGVIASPWPLAASEAWRVAIPSIMRLPPPPPRGQACRLLAMTVWRAEWRPLAATIGGSLAGLIINPYFPENLKFYWMQIVQIALVNYQSKIGVGGEWYQFDLSELVSYSGPVILVFIFGMMFFFGKIFLTPPPCLPLSTEGGNTNAGFSPLVIKGGVRGRIAREAIKDIFFFVLAAGAFFILTLKSCRNTEYFFPFAILSSAFIFKYFWDNDLYLRFKKNIHSFFKKEFLYSAFVAYLFLAFILNFGLNFWKIKQELARGFSFDYYKGAMEVVQKNSRPADIIFHSDWDDWPMLFYHNEYNRYIVGLDATFMYKYDKELFKKWRDITWGDFKGDPYGIIKNDFHAAFIFVAKNDIDIMDKYFKNDMRYELLYDKEGKVYKIR